VAKKSTSGLWPSGRPHTSRKNPFLHVDLGSGKGKQHRRITPDKNGLGSFAIGWASDSGRRSSKQKRKKK
jgi:hypothetical protein